MAICISYSFRYYCNISFKFKLVLNIIRIWYNIKCSTARSANWLIIIKDCKRRPRDGYYYYYYYDIILSTLNLCDLKIAVWLKVHDLFDFFSAIAADILYYYIMHIRFKFLVQNISYKVFNDYILCSRIIKIIK